jgi:hypothetical protein
MAAETIFRELMSKGVQMKQLVLFIVLFVATAAVYAAEGYQLSGEAGGYKVVMNFAESRPTEGTNAVEIVVTDASSRPVKAALVKVEYLMPSLPGKKPMMDYATTAKPEGDVYKATLNTNMKGEWRAVVTIVKGEEKRTVILPFEVR